jgi:hypothetical protein
MLRYIRGKSTDVLLHDFVAWVVPGIIGRVLAFVVSGIFLLASCAIFVMQLRKLFP